MFQNLADEKQEDYIEEQNEEIVNTKNITDRYAIIETAVDFSKLETVLVIK